MLAFAVGVMRIASGVRRRVFLQIISIRRCGMVCLCGLRAFVAVFTFGNARRGPLDNRKDCKEQTDNRMKYGRCHKFGLALHQ